MNELRYNAPVDAIPWLDGATLDLAAARGLTDLQSVLRAPAELLNSDELQRLFRYAVLRRLGEPEDLAVSLSDTTSGISAAELARERQGGALAAQFSAAMDAPDADVFALAFDPPAGADPALVRVARLVVEGGVDVHTARAFASLDVTPDALRFASPAELDSLIRASREYRDPTLAVRHPGHLRPEAGRPEKPGELPCRSPDFDHDGARGA